MGTVVAGAVLLTIAVLSHVYKRLPRARNYLYLLAGVCFIGGFAQYGVSVATWLTDLIAPMSSSFLGIGASVVGVVIAVALLFLMFHSLWPKKGKPAGWHGPVFFFAPAVLLATLGGPVGGVVGALTDAVTTVTGQIGL